MNDKLKCPFCQQELREIYCYNVVMGYLCPNPDCKKAEKLKGNAEFWQELIKLMEEKQHKTTATDQQDEVWKDVVGYEGLYRISNQGTVCRLYKNGKVNFMTPRILNASHIGECISGKRSTAGGYHWKLVSIIDAYNSTRKALDVAKDTIRHADWFFDGDYNVDAKTMHNEIKYAIKAITALEQKDVK